MSPRDAAMEAVLVWLDNNQEGPQPLPPAGLTARELGEWWAGYQEAFDKFATLDAEANEVADKLTDTLLIFWYTFLVLLSGWVVVHYDMWLIQLAAAIVFAWSVNKLRTTGD